MLQNTISFLQQSYPYRRIQRITRKPIAQKTWQKFTYAALPISMHSMLIQPMNSPLLWQDKNQCHLRTKGRRHPAHLIRD